VSVTAYECRIAQRFAEFLGQREGKQCAVTPADNPPDFWLTVGHTKSWLEITDVFINNEEAKWLNRRSDAKFMFGPLPVDAVAMRLFTQLDEKLTKSSYENAVIKTGQKGVLLLTSQHSAFGEVDLAHVEAGVAAFKPSNDRCLFKAAFFEYRFGGEAWQYLDLYSGT
jgi:hypothetical protein